MNHGEAAEDTQQTSHKPETPKEEANPSSSTVPRSGEGWFGGGVCLFVAALCALSFVEGISVNGLLNINISNLERRFELNSRQTGFILSSGEIGAITFVLFVSYYGGRSHRPRVVAAGGFLLAVGCFFFLMPHVFVDLYKVDLDLKAEEGCGVGSGSNQSCSDGSGSQESSASRLFPLFIVGQVLQGIGFTPAFTCGFAYIDDHASAEHTAVYIGVTYAITALGVGVGYAVGGNLLSLWVDIGRTDVSKITITDSDKRWVGAWWIGYAVCGVLFILVASIICLFPRYLAGSKALKQKQLDNASASAPGSTPGQRKQSFWQLILSFPKALLDLIRNYLYILLVLVGLGDSLLVSGIAGFAPKIIEEKFNVKPTESGLIMGTVTLMGGAGGMALGGFLIQKFSLKLRGIMRMCFMFLLVGAILGGGCFFIHCPQQRFAGINSVYSLAKHKVPEAENLTAQCNSNCSCNTYRFDPVCGQDGVTYFSSCHAGCPSQLAAVMPLVGDGDGDGHTKMFNSCACVSDALLDGGDGGNGTRGSALSGQCAGACPQVWPFVVVLFLAILFTCLNVTPISMGILRCVSSAERSVALGLQWVTIRMLASIPGPILLGAVLDTSCQLWQSTCNGRGNCWVYHDRDMSLRLFLLWVVVKCSGLLLLSLAYFLYTKKGHPVVEENERNSKSVSFSVSENSLNSARTSRQDRDAGAGGGGGGAFHGFQVEVSASSAAVDSTSDVDFRTSKKSTEPRSQFTSTPETSMLSEAEPSSQFTSTPETNMLKGKELPGGTLSGRTGKSVAGENPSGVDLQILGKQDNGSPAGPSEGNVDHGSPSPARVFPSDQGAGSKGEKKTGFKFPAVSESTYL